MIKRPIVNVPQNNGDASRFLAEIGAAQNEISAIQDKLNEEVTELIRKAEEKAAAPAARIKERLDGLYVFAEGKRAEITAGGGKTMSVATGSFGWRLTPPKVTIRNEESVLRTLKARGLENLIRVRESVDKEAIHRDPEGVKGIRGITITQTEEFFARPITLSFDITLDSDAAKITTPKKNPPRKES